MASMAKAKPSTRSLRARSRRGAVPRSSPAVTRVALIGAASAKFMWQLIEARVRANVDIKRYLKKYQDLYKLYVKEAGSAVTEERSRIACDIHDGLVQTLVGINLKLDLCRGLIFSDPTRSFDLLSDAKSQLKAAIEESRQVIFNLRPLYFESMGLVP